MCGTILPECSWAFPQPIDRKHHTVQLDSTKIFSNNWYACRRPVLRRKAPIAVTKIARHRYSHLGSPENVSPNPCSLHLLAFADKTFQWEYKPYYRLNSLGTPKLDRFRWSAIQISIHAWCAIKSSRVRGEQRNDVSPRGEQYSFALACTNRWKVNLGIFWGLNIFFEYLARRGQ